MRRFVVAILMCNMLYAAETVSGPSYCQVFKEAKEKRLAKSGNLEAIRKLRDFYLDCSLGKELDQALYWAKRAAEKGNAEDKEVLSQLSQVLS
ncbi:hypothetical protein ACUHMQ_16420 [Chitinimonas sp. PSY-7]|uniref:hypothetical protein n=1 Tax=Chitinimonas sp. PSY-7 TaxID=3459088 RepID=UPI0040401D15